MAFLLSVIKANNIHSRAIAHRINQKTIKIFIEFQKIPPFAHIDCNHTNTHKYLSKFILFIVECLKLLFVVKEQKKQWLVTCMFTIISLYR